MWNVSRKLSGAADASPLQMHPLGTPLSQSFKSGLRLQAPKLLLPVPFLNLTLRGGLCRSGEAWAALVAEYLLTYLLTFLNLIDIVMSRIRHAAVAIHLGRGSGPCSFLGVHGALS